jgi:hypothetical protein
MLSPAVSWVKLCGQRCRQFGERRSSGGHLDHVAFLADDLARTILVKAFGSAECASLALTRHVAGWEISDTAVAY